MKLAALAVVFSASVALGQRPSFAGSRPIGYPEVTTTPSNGLEDKFGEVDATTQRLPLEANGDRDLVDRLSKLPIDKQPFWFINWQALEAHREKPQTYPQKPNIFIDPVPNSPNSGNNFVPSGSVNSNSGNVAPGSFNTGSLGNGFPVNSNTVNPTNSAPSSFNSGNPATGLPTVSNTGNPSNDVPSNFNSVSPSNGFPVNSNTGNPANGVTSNFNPGSSVTGFPQIVNAGNPNGGPSSFNSGIPASGLPVNFNSGKPVSSIPSNFNSGSAGSNIPVISDAAFGTSNRFGELSQSNQNKKPEPHYVYTNYGYYSPYIGFPGYLFPNTGIQSQRLRYQQ